ncbi:hypothetical protein V496_05382 [Pseudogymnoascus sp. VKM F-4515 (FW-2607)]|nr:hypothetical protein V496_05382 [Pseudogymnoascus sp. VKM F-4515 (FW-2607)]
MYFRDRHDFPIVALSGVTSLQVYGTTMKFLTVRTVHSHGHWCYSMGIKRCHGLLTALSNSITVTMRSAASLLSFLVGHLVWIVSQITHGVFTISFTPALEEPPPQENTHKVNMAIQKSRISGPVGVAPAPKVVKANPLPSQHTEAFEYISSRLIRKHINLSLILVREDTPLPAAPSPPLEPESPTSPTTSFFSRLSPTLSVSSVSSISSTSSTSSTTPSWPLPPTMLPSPPSPRSPRSPRSLFSPRIFSLPSSPLSPRSPTHSMRSMPATPTTLTPLTIPTTPQPLITLLHAIPPTPKAAATLTKILDKASLRFPFRFAVPAAQPTLTHRSLQQHQILFSSEGLTLLSLDRIYTLKHALATYSRLLSTGASAPAIATALARSISELRALVFTQAGRPIANTYLQRSYDHLRVSPFALRAVNSAGGAEAGDAADAEGEEGERERGDDEEF